jgi:hypothetical protein
MGQLLFERTSGSCPALRFTDQSAECGLMTDPAAFAPVRAAIHGVKKMREAAKRIIGAGTGCHASYEREPLDETFPQRQRTLSRKQALEYLRVWGMHKSWKFYPAAPVCDPRRASSATMGAAACDARRI